MSTRRTFLVQTAAATVIAAAEVQLASAVAKDDATSSSISMKTYQLPQTELVVSRMAYGCARLAGWDQTPVSIEETTRAERVVRTAHDHGITLFDHADLYAFGKCEDAFGQVLSKSPGLRNRIIIQTKCGQRFADGRRPGMPIYVDLSREHIVASVEGSLRRLRTDYLDILLLHAPSTLVRPEQVAGAFDHLHRSGKVRYFGVSNYTPTQIQLLQKAVSQPIVVNQIHLGLAHSDPLNDGLEFTLELAKGLMKYERYQGITGSGTFDFCRRHNIQIQAWSPLRGVLLDSPVNAAPPLKATAQKLTDLAKEKNSAPSALALAWLLHHPAGIVPITGASNPDHIIENCSADRITFSDEEWYSLFATAADLKSRAI